MEQTLDNYDFGLKGTQWRKVKLNATNETMHPRILGCKEILGGI